VHYFRKYKDIETYHNQNKEVERYLVGLPCITGYFIIVR